MKAGETIHKQARYGNASYIITSPRIVEEINAINNREKRERN